MLIRRYDPTTYAPVPLFPRIRDSINGWWVPLLVLTIFGVPILCLLFFAYKPGFFLVLSWWKLIVIVAIGGVWTHIERQLSVVNNEYWTFEQMTEQRLRALERAE